MIHEKVIAIIKTKTNYLKYIVTAKIFDNYDIDFCRPDDCFKMPTLVKVSVLRCHRVPKNVKIRFSNMTVCCRELKVIDYEVCYLSEVKETVEKMIRKYALGRIVFLTDF